MLSREAMEPPSFRARSETKATPPNTSCFLNEKGGHGTQKTEHKKTQGTPETQVRQKSQGTQGTHGDTGHKGTVTKFFKIQRPYGDQP